MKKEWLALSVQDWCDVGECEGEEVYVRENAPGLRRGTVLKAQLGEPSASVVC